MQTVAAASPERGPRQFQTDRKFASNNRQNGTDAENKAVVQGALAYYGTYEVDESNKSLIMRIKDAGQFSALPASRCPLWVISGHVRCESQCPLRAKSGHDHPAQTSNGTSSLAPAGNANIFCISSSLQNFVSYQSYLDCSSCRLLSPLAFR
jgi:hypothetical protein